MTSHTIGALRGIVEAQRRNATHYREYARASRGRTRAEWERLAETADHVAQAAERDLVALVGYATSASRS